MVSRWHRFIDRVSGRGEILQELKETRNALSKLTVESELIERRLFEAEKKRGKTGVAPAWGYQSAGMTPEKHSKLRALCDAAHTSHPLAKKAMRLKRSFICSEGFKLEATYNGGSLKVNGKVLSQDEVKARTQDYLDEHWEINWEGQIGNRTETLNTLGELCAWSPPPCPVTGQFRIGLIDSGNIEGIVPDPLNIERAEFIEFDQAMRFTVDGEKASPRKRVPVVERCWQTKKYVGEMLYLGVNTLGTKHRGLSDLTPIIDYLEVFDQLVWTEADRVKMMRSMLFQYIMKGEKDPKVIKAMQMKLSKQPPPPGSFLCTNESIDIKEICPNLNSASSLEFIKYIFGLCSGCLDLPEHFYYSAGSVNRASAQEMTDPVYAGVRDRKREIVEFLHMEHAFALQKAAKIETSLVHGFTGEALKFEVTSRNPERDALDVIGQHLTSLAQALTVYEASEWVSSEQVARIARQELSRLTSTDLEEEEVPNPDEIEAKVAERMDRIRTIDGEPENFPLSLDEDGGQEWRYSA